MSVICAPQYLIAESIAAQFPFIFYIAMHILRMSYYLIMFEQHVFLCRT